VARVVCIVVVVFVIVAVSVGVTKARAGVCDEGGRELFIVNRLPGLISNTYVLERDDNRNEIYRAVHGLPDSWQVTGNNMPASRMTRSLNFPSLFLADYTLSDGGRIVRRVGFNYWQADFNGTHIDTDGWSVDVAIHMLNRDSGEPFACMRKSAYDTDLVPRYVVSLVDQSEKQPPVELRQLFELVCLIDAHYTRD
jgi:hypothetical protein